MFYALVQYDNVLQIYILITCQQKLYYQLSIRKYKISKYIVFFYFFFKSVSSLFMYFRVLFIKHIYSYNCYNFLTDPLIVINYLFHFKNPLLPTPVFPPSPCSGAILQPPSSSCFPTQSILAPPFCKSC